MTPERRLHLVQSTVALAALYVLVAAQYFLAGGAEHVGVRQSLLLSWAFAVAGVVAAFVPTHPRPPHLRHW